MARGRMDANHRPNTLKENKIVLSELRSRGKLEQRTSHELDRLFAKLNWDSAPKHWKNGKAARSNKQEKTPAEHHYGPVDGFPPGSWWGIRMDCSRDRIHGPFNADIEDGPVGAVSLCTSHLNGHNDEDLGDWLTFTGGKYEPGVQRSDDPLLRSYQSQVPLRLVRSYNLSNDFAPKTGYRYDGLYTVAAWWIGVSSDSEKRYKFALVRLRNQEPPVWQESIGPQTRCNAERFSTNVCGETTHSSVNDEDTAAGSSRGRGEAVKFSFNKSHVADKMTSESKRKTQDSSIVTRCISVKKAECPYSESPVMNAHRALEGSAKPAPCKLQNTNISIRTDLYDSSHNIQHELKKSIPMTFCRTFVSARNTRVVNSHSHVGTLNLNTCGPCPRDGEQESLIQSRSGNMSKVSATQSPCSESNPSADRSTPNISTVASPIEAKMHFDTFDGRISQISGTVHTSDCATGDMTEAKRLEHREQRDKENSRAKTSDEIDDDPNPVCPINRTSSRKTVETPPESEDRDEPRDEMLRQQQRTVLDSFTPEQMLKYIVKQKYHPTAKLLIGSVIGLATGESKILRTYDSLISRNKSWSRDKKLHGEQCDSTSSGKDEQTVNRAQGTSDKPIKKERSVGKSTASQKRGTKERILTMRLRRTRVSKRLLGGEKKSGAKNADDSSDRLRKSKETEKTQQPFSKSTSPKNSKKSAKKRRSELANLAIDANIGPKIRGPRNRRLRGRSHIFTKKRHDMDLASCCGGSRGSDVGVRGKKVTSRVELPSMRSKRLISAVKPPRIPQSRYIEHKKRVQKTETSNVKRKIQRSAITLSVGNMTNSSRKREKRKVSPPPPPPSPPTRSREQVSGSSSSDDSSKRLCRRTEKDASTIDRIISMVDAATQCSSQRDTDVEGPNADPENSVKVEWIDLDDVKSESCASDGAEEFVLELASENYKSSEIETTIRDEPGIQEKSKGILPIRPLAEKPQIANVAQRLSAFVPVNISDNDFRIARLRSIGFRPIDPVCARHEEDKCTACCASGSSKDPAESTVVNRVADEQYNKYTSEETTVVGYMDQELRFEDIEEDVVTVIRDIKNPRVGVKTGNKVTRVRSKNPETARDAKTKTQKTRLVAASLEDDSEIPWHGWKKFVKNKQAYWIGW